MVKIFLFLIISWFVFLICAIILSKKYRYFYSSLLFSTLLLFFGLKIISNFLPNTLSNKNSSSDFFIKKKEQYSDFSFNLMPSSWLNSLDKRGEENIIPIEQRNKIGNFFPLGGSPNTNIYYCIEDEGHIFYKTDKFGFRNDNEIWKDKNHDILILGDSFVEGACVQKSIPQLINNNLKIVNLGKSGNGPLTSLAVLKEYIEHYKVKQIYHIIYSNDFSRNFKSKYDIDLNRELKDNYLLSYLNKENINVGYFSDLDLLPLKNFSIEYSNLLIKKKYKKKYILDLANIFSYTLISNIFEILNYKYFNKNEKFKLIDEKKLLDIYKEMIRVSKNNFSQITFLLIPNKYDNCLDNQRSKFIKNLLSENQITYIDLKNFLCQRINYSTNGVHYNAKGYKKLADFIKADFEKKGIK